MKGKLAGSVLAVILAGAGWVVTQWEGTRYEAYQDITGVWTICQGHTRGVEKGDTATPAQCAEYLRADLLIAEKAIRRCIREPLTMGQHQALLSAVYNLGPRVVCDSTLRRKANAGKPFCAELLRWVYAGGEVVQGLVNRRHAEYALCRSPCAQSALDLLGDAS